MQNRTQQKFSGASDYVEGLLLIFYTRQVDNDGAALQNNFWLSYANRVNSCANNFNSNIETCRIEITLGLQSDRSTTLQVETKGWRVSGYEICNKSRCDDNDQQRQRNDVATFIHLFLNNLSKKSQRLTRLASNLPKLCGQLSPW